jgi:hypothetical protein
VSDHLDIPKLTAMMFGRTALTEDEDSHLTKCTECKTSMVENTLKQLLSGSEPDKEPADSE